MMSLSYVFFAVKGTKIEPDKDLVVRIATIDELKKNGFKEWFEVRNK